MTKANSYWRKAGKRCISDGFFSTVAQWIQARMHGPALCTKSHRRSRPLFLLYQREEFLPLLSKDKKKCQNTCYSVLKRGRYKTYGENIRTLCSSIPARGVCQVLTRQQPTRLRRWEFPDESSTVRVVHNRVFTELEWDKFFFFFFVVFFFLKKVCFELFSTFCGQNRPPVPCLRSCIYSTYSGRTERNGTTLFVVVRSVPR